MGAHFVFESTPLMQAAAAAWWSYSRLGSSGRPLTLMTPLLSTSMIDMKAHISCSVSRLPSSLMVVLQAGSIKQVSHLHACVYMCVCTCLRAGMCVCVCVCAIMANSVALYITLNRPWAMN